MTERSNIIEKDTFLGPQSKSNQYFFDKGLELQNPSDLESGQTGQVVRDIIRYRLLLELYCTGQIKENNPVLPTTLPIRA